MAGQQRSTSDKIVSAGEFIQELGAVAFWLAVVLVISVPLVIGALS